MRVVAADCDVNTSGEDAKALLAFCSTPLEKRHSRDDRKKPKQFFSTKEEVELKNIKPLFEYIKSLIVKLIVYIKNVVSKFLNLFHT